MSDSAAEGSRPGTAGPPWPALALSRWPSRRAPSEHGAATSPFPEPAP